MEVEVVFPKVCGAFYKAFLLDINLTNKEAKVGFPNNWRPVAWTELGYIRYPDTSETVGSNKSLSQGSKVEALLPHHDNEVPGWWAGVLLKSKGELNVVEFQSGTEKYQDIVELEKLRTPNNIIPLSKVELLTKIYPVPDDIRDYCQRTSIHENFRAKIKAVCVMFNSTDQVLTVVADNTSCLDRAEMLIEMHFRDLSTQKSLYARNEMVAHRMSHSSALKYPSQEDPSMLEIRFHVPIEYVGLAIGRDGTNVNEARRFDGIVSIEFDDYSSMFSVKGKTKEALLKAQERLEYTKDTMLIPRNLAGKVIGKRGSVINEIIEKSLVNSINVAGDGDAKKRNIETETVVAFDFVGRKSAIENAKLMMEYHIDHLKDVESILQTRRELGSDDDTPTYFPRPRGDYKRGRGSKGRRGYSNHGDREGRQQSSDGSNTALEDVPSVEEHERNETTNSQNQQEEDHLQDSDSDSGPSVEDCAESDEDRKSPPEDDDQGPDRRRQRGDSERGRGESGRGRGGRGGRGRAGYRQNRRGRGGARGGGRGGHWNQNNTGKLKEETKEETTPPNTEQTGENATASPRSTTRTRANPVDKQSVTELTNENPNPSPPQEQPQTASPVNENNSNPTENAST